MKHSLSLIRVGRKSHLLTLSCCSSIFLDPYFEGSGCEGTTTVQASISSSCGQPLDGVTFESQDIMSVTPGSSSGMYSLQVCSLPLEVTCAAEEYESLTSTITEKSVEMQMTCIGEKSSCRK